MSTTCPLSSVHEKNGYHVDFQMADNLNPILLSGMHILIVEQQQQ